jgi:hypothetical protein
VGQNKVGVKKKACSTVSCNTVGKGWRQTGPRGILYLGVGKDRNGGMGQEVRNEGRSQN